MNNRKKVTLLVCLLLIAWVAFSTIHGATPILEQPPLSEPIGKWIVGYIAYNGVILVAAAFQFFAFFVVFGVAARVPPNWLVAFLYLLDAFALAVGLGYLAGSPWRGFPAIFSGLFMLVYSGGGWLGLQLTLRVFRKRLAPG